ncbi:MAG: tRNA uridine(34) 5-carboxymethylaminomethyl modification radical SAM/GNAT enzyme Elp3 [Nanoarchaeota archaeon]|nr:tRNA uridine(34) 5-carboxymethylaminomethyl modification radical SAM/GNAT enzyme Elp3 [Nanoarchaeota archaeon]MBU1622884.1 tRNA uridine(34) 5-carboxymethylaminomethyl modification radical SAM/GNAT enzyme Elp3 [Nanoarchaeota archaeon]MBU1974713.1 tRNA uridine(34) 5-carboxymethylaminomethyl modification radical SAM/GNAT enzyme Elp3 [Nanoarchaeota archaeon]
MNFYQEIIPVLKEKEFNSRQFAKLKRDLSQKYKLKSIPTNIEILLNCDEKDIPFLKKQLLTKPVRSISGVAPVAIMTKPFPCPHGKCIMCPGGVESEFGDVPQSYTGREPATMRGIRNKYSAYLQVFNRLEQFTILGHNCEKVELILMGGTFPSFPLEYQEEFVTDAFQAMNIFSEMFYVDGEFDYLAFKDFFELPVEDLGDQERIARLHQKLLGLKKETTLINEQKRNETAKIKCTALCIETRPDYGLLVQGNEMLRLGCTRVELGIQSVYDDVLVRIQRGHTTADTINSIRVLKDLGFKVAGHYMPGLPSVDKKRDLAGMKELFSDDNYKPDMLKIYPCMVTKGTKLYDEWKMGKYQPLTANEAAKLIMEFKKFVPEYCRIMRVQRDIPTYQISAGVEMTNLRQFMHDKYDLKCRCIRCREPKGKEINWDKVEMKVNEYGASQGKEYFISVEDVENDLLIGFCRLRFPSSSLRREITSTSALIRELHVYGVAIGIGEEGAVQHQGWGKKLMEKAEEIAKGKGKDKMIVISGVGVRDYYRKLGYKLEGVYMIKKI